jgi:hypothetical protein
MILTDLANCMYDLGDLRKALATTSTSFGLSAEAETSSGIIAGIGPLELPGRF